MKSGVIVTLNVSVIYLINPPDRPPDLIVKDSVHECRVQPSYFNYGDKDQLELQIEYLATAKFMMELKKEIADTPPVKHWGGVWKLTTSIIKYNIIESY